ncbi:mitochondrial protein [Thecamonas trahens ATCC 50062]|uniref:Mitochondrial fission process protein 1 n=1 Tax=Thecamonas trahens ATCC 50062 TaxID=461836 RepID=A0A0L0D9C8_THETB|nr:mitochondrial protein [Thecamonas trahens ATCC 50062]KNC48845.1 mitochondrial protein [Thecamonas trahens ATCC 50062]|eukprot:XP_013758265.1 mitochondrial protein [Thecamonas trahens ATCC 50062]
MACEEKDLFRDTPVRFLGYANELGESLRPIIARSLVNTTYGVAGLYIAAEAVSKGSAKHAVMKGKCSETERTAMTTAQMADVVIWQGAASVAIPGLVINRIVASVGWATKRMGRTGGLWRWAPTVCGLLSIPLIIHPIDTAVTVAMDATIRSWIPYMEPEKPRASQ